MRTALTSLLAAALLVASASGGKAAKESKFPLSGENTKVEFVGSKPDGKHEGGFKEMTGMATVKGNDLTTLKVQIEIETDSLFSDDEKLTAHLKSPDFFNVKKHPKAKFVSTKVEKTTAGYAIAGKLTMLGETKDVSIAAKITLTDKGLNINGSCKIDRTEWGMTTGKGKIDDDVSLTVAVAAKR